ncbi:hypothetical protein CRG98_049336, partial [Punica granatum]
GRRGRGRQSATPNPESNEDKLEVPGRFGVLGCQSVTQTPPSRSSAPTEDVGDLDGGVGVADWRPRTPNRPGTSRKSPVDSEFEAANRRPRPLH